MRAISMVMRPARLLAGLAFGCLATAAMAEVAEAPLNLQATVLSGCNITTAPDTLRFNGGAGIIPTGGQPQADTSFAVRCTAQQAYSIYATGTRELSGPGSPLAYSIVIGAPSSGMSDTSLPDASPGIGRTGTGIAESYVISARLGAIDTTVPPGIYNGTLTLKIEYTPN